MLRVIALFCFVCFFSLSSYSKECLDIFPKSPVPHPLLSYDEHFINIPINNANQTLIDNTMLERGNNFYSASLISNGGKITVGPSSHGEVTARLYLKGSINWWNVEVNKNGNPEDLIIYINGTLEIKGDDTEINAIIYATGSITILDDADISGAVASEANISLGSDVEIEYESDIIEDADFNGMCLNSIIPKCDVFFPGEHPFSAVTPLQNSDFNGISQCNGSRCIINDVKNIVPRVPVIPAGGSYLGQYNRGTLSDDDYNFFNSWSKSQTTVKFTDDDGTAVIYIRSTSDIILPSNLKLNVDGEPANVLLVIESDTNIQIDKGSRINAFLYLRAPNIKFNNGIEVDEHIEINGGIAVDTENLVIDGNGVFNYDSTQLDNFEPHDFCRVDEPEEVVSTLANFNFDECSYSGTVGEVIDQTTNFSGQAFQGVNTTKDGQIERFINLSNQSHHMQTSVPLPEEFSVSTWFKKPTSTTDGRYFVLGAMSQGGDLMYLDRSNGWRWGVYNLRGATNGSYSFASLDNNWHHLVLVYEEDETELYIDGVLVDTVERGVTGTLKYIGTSFDGPNTQGFRAPLDEFMIFDESLSEEDVEQIYTNQSKKLNFDGSNRTPVTCPTFDHFEIDTIDAEGLTCQADNIVIKACADPACSILNNESFSVNLLVNGVSNREVKIIGGSTITNYAYTTLGNASLSLDQNYYCKNSSDTPCNVNFKDSGFVFGNDSSDKMAIPTQLSGKPSNIGFNAKNIFLQALATNEVTGACEGVFPDGGDIPVNLSYSCASDNCADNEVYIFNNVNPTSGIIQQTPSEHILRFTSDSKSYLSVVYSDAGKIALNVQKDIEIKDDGGNKVIKDFNGMSNDFVVRPFGFFMNILNNPEAQDATDSIFKKAGEYFSIELKSVVWENHDDLNYDGIPDPNSDLSTNAITENFGKERLAETAVLNLALVAPNSGVLGELTSKTYGFDKGIANDDKVSYSEVGIISVIAKLSSNSYLGTSDVQSKTTNIGRFTPSYFKQTIKTGDHGSLIANHNNSVSTCKMLNWTYSGQLTNMGGAKLKGSIQYLNAPMLTITAFNSADEVTQNYSGDFAKLANLLSNSDNKISFKAALATHVDNTLSLTGDVSELGYIKSNRDGVLTYQLSTEHHFVYTRNSLSRVTPFLASFELPFKEFKDADDITFKVSDTKNYFETPKFYQRNAIMPDIAAFNNTLEIRFGRAVLDNSFGPETSNLPQPLHIQFLESIGNYVKVSDDKCTTWNSNLITLTTKSLHKNITSSLGGTGFFVEGSTRKIYLKATSDNEGVESPSDAQGEVYVEYTVAPWLKYDWAYDNEGVDGLYNDNPRSVASFGVFRGNDRIIYHREIAN
jgi:MSHA biogenesis protein MshQ